MTKMNNLKSVIEVKEEMQKVYNRNIDLFSALENKYVGDFAQRQVLYSMMYRRFRWYQTRIAEELMVGIKDGTAYFRFGRGINSEGIISRFKEDTSKMNDFLEVMKGNSLFSQKDIDVMKDKLSRRTNRNIKKDCMKVASLIIQDICIE